mmetsp:Transcript_4632/g.10143  ORF Transcript_4632/g.10143 Transcript_4632/m.10143 type:complete len:455 (+) Transcript_4632:317-1681(+)|eukprot:CAMPEP_0168179772 /NCGR_PEP_ID=MMETSP0139_2-20121125/10056_1 /TAXON_ID=44445 /ORGANISM="Pseudo-nitzschia australis, Strain 10249 10 AB" /LENGTH=454 /DNA_ID=CAMNT_0008099693 /DNA_START=301 /DNA_END=1665 /DNA_ORIENTATION=+
MVYNPLLVGFCCLLAAALSEPAFSFARPLAGSAATRNTMGGKQLQQQEERAHHRMSHSLSDGAVNPEKSNNKSIGNDDDTASVLSESTMYFGVLQDAVHLNSTAAASALLSKITEMRQSSENTIEEQESFLNTLLALGPDARLPIWTKIRPLARFSRRARMRILRRTLDRITPPAADTDKESDTVKSQLQRRRRALVSLLRSLSDEGAARNNNSRCPAIVALETKAIEASKDSATDLTSRRPEGLETPDYDLVESGRDATNRMAKNVEIRRYKPYSVCAVSMAKPRPSDSAKTDQKLGAPELKGASSFGALAGYLFGKNDKSTAMKMTTPVFTANVENEKAAVTGEEDDRQMEFVLPSNYWGTDNLSKAPLPLEGSGVTLQERNGEDRAVLMFGGYASKKEVEKRKRELFSTLSKRDSKWKPIENTDSLAQYNDPFTVPWRRLNEVSIKVVDGQ